MAPLQTAVVFTFKIGQNLIFFCIVPGLKISTAALGIMRIAVAVILHEASELIAVAYGLRVAELRV